MLTYLAITEHMGERVIIEQETYVFSSQLRHYKDVLMAYSLVIPAALTETNYNFILKQNIHISCHPESSQETLEQCTK